jgi:antitoxin (DNA-binding transcriptional repressor) of toxin-antitoxin stability system
MGTDKVSVREAQEGLRCLLDQVKAGDDAVVLRRGVEVGRLVPPERRPPPLTDLGRLRASVKLRGRTLSQDIRKAGGFPQIEAAEPR